MESERAEWDAFRLREFGEPYMVWHDGPDFGPLIARCLRDPGEVERMLRVGLRRHDPLAAEAIDVLGARGALVSDFSQDLSAAMEKASGQFRIATAKTLILRTHQQQWTADIIDVLLNDNSQFVRLDAAHALSLVESSEAVVEALATAVADPDYLVRYQAANAMLSLSHAGFTVDKDERLFSLIRGQTQPSSWQHAATALRERFPSV